MNGKQRMIRKRIDLAPLVIGAAIGLAASARAAPPAAAAHRVSAAKPPYFFCDPRVVEDHWRIERFVVTPVRHPANPLITRKYPWEGSGPQAIACGSSSARRARRGS